MVTPSRSLVRGGPSWSRWALHNPRWFASGFGFIAFLLGFPAAEYAVHGYYPGSWPVDVRGPEVWFSALANSYGLDALRAYRLLALGQTTSLGALGLPVLLCIVAGPLVALVFCFLPQVAADPCSGKPPFRRPRDLLLVLMISFATTGVIAMTVHNTPERVIRFDQPVVLTFTYADGYSERYALPQDGPVAMMGHPTPALVRLRFWNEARGYGVADVYDDWVQRHVRP
jgi:hypothetical protein